MVKSGIEKIYIEYSKNIDGEWGTFTRTCSSLDEAMDFISTSDKVYTFKLKVIRKKNS